MVSTELKERLAELAARYRIRLAVVFGSSVSGRLHPRSDLDLAVSFERPGTDLTTLIEFQHELQAALPERRLDLVMLDRADPLLLNQIAARCELAFGRPEDALELRRYAFRRYQDHRRFLEMERAWVRRYLDTLPRAS